MSSAPIFVVEDDADTAALYVRWLEKEGYEVEHLVDAEELLAALRRYAPSLVCLDLDLPGMGGLDALERLRVHLPRLPVLVLTANREVATVVRAMQLGASDYAAKPVDQTRLLTSVANATERSRLDRRVRELERRVRGTAGPSGIIGRSAPMQRLFSELDHVAESDITVLLRGESGTGKELVARAIHEGSGRAEGPFVPLNCAAVPEALMESEFFGHEKGAFTGANERRAGRFEQADGGTLFLDEVAELALPLQAKLLRALQERKVTRVGGSEEIAVDFRLVAATHRDLLERVSAGEFREDLYYRLAVFELDLPPLRDRHGDLPLLCEHLLEHLAPGRELSLDSAAMAVLEAHGFPGNVRELENALHRASVVCKAGPIRVEHLPKRLLAGAGVDPSTSGPGPSSVSAAQPSGPSNSMEDIEREALRAALERADGNVASVVRELGIGRTTVYRKMKKYGLR